jgi:predicted DNA-binding protein
MPRPKKDNHPLSMRIDKNIYERLNQYCEDSGQTKTMAIERALVSYMDDYYQQQDELKKLK